MSTEAYGRRYVKLHHQLNPPAHGRWQWITSWMKSVSYMSVGRPWVVSYMSVGGPWVVSYISVGGPWVDIMNQITRSKNKCKHVMYLLQDIKHCTTWIMNYNYRLQTCAVYSDCMLEHKNEFPSIFQHSSLNNIRPRKTLIQKPFL